MPGLYLTGDQGRNGLDALGGEGRIDLAVTKSGLCPRNKPKEGYEEADAPYQDGAKDLVPLW
jgi:hypothetical protein